MNDQELRAKVQKALDGKLSGLQDDPWLAQRIMNKADREEPIVKKKISFSIVFVIVAVLALGTALAVTLNTDFVSRVFGNTARTSVSGHTETFDDGKGGTCDYFYPAREYVAVDPEEAERLLGGNGMDEPVTVQMGDHTLTILDAVRDENAMILDMTLECPTGVRGLNYDTLTNEGKGAWFAEDAGYFFGVDRAPEMIYVDLAASTENCLRIYYYCLFLEKLPEGESPVLIAAVGESESDPSNSVFDPREIPLPVKHAVSAVRFAAADGSSAELSPFSLRVCPVSEGQAPGDVIVVTEPEETIRLQLASGETFTVKEPGTDNTMYLCGALGENAADTSIVLNRLIDPAAVTAIRIGETEYLPVP